MAKVVHDKERNLIRVEGKAGQIIREVGKFGTSVLYEYEGFNFHPRAFEVLSKINRLRFREDDVLLTMFPKSGSTWLSECIYLIVNQYKYELALKESIEYRFPQIDSPSHDVFDLICEQYDNVGQQRMIKSSIPPHLLINNDTASRSPPKVISIFRNPRDVLVSFYHHCRTVKHYDVDLSFDEFFYPFVAGRVPCGPIWLMYNQAYKYHKENPKTSLIIFYENMKKDLRGQIKRICDFLNKPEPANEEEWLRLMDHLSVERMRQNRTINRHDWTQQGLRNPDGFEFVRKGQVNDWKNFFSESQSLLFDQEVRDKLVPELQQVYRA